MLAVFMLTAGAAWSQDSTDRADSRPPMRPAAGNSADASSTIADNNDSVAQWNKWNGQPTRRKLKERKADYYACLSALDELGTEYQRPAPVREAEDANCGIERPVSVTSILPQIKLSYPALMRCDTAKALGLWVRDFVLQAAAKLPDAPALTGIELGTTYDCRSRIGAASTPKPSEHAFGNAIDITAFSFNGVEPVPIMQRQNGWRLCE